MFKVIETTTFINEGSPVIIVAVFQVNDLIYAQADVVLLKSGESSILLHLDPQDIDNATEVNEQQILEQWITRAKDKFAQWLYQSIGNQAYAQVNGMAFREIQGWAQIALWANSPLYPNTYESFNAIAIDTSCIELRAFLREALDHVRD